MTESFSPAQLQQLRDLLREELQDIGLRTDGGDHTEEARRDFMFLRSLRVGANGLAARLGWLIIAAIASGIAWVVVAGLNSWKDTH